MSRNYLHAICLVIVSISCSLAIAYKNTHIEVFYKTMDGKEFRAIRKKDSSGVTHYYAPPEYYKAFRNEPNN